MADNSTKSDKVVLVGDFGVGKTTIFTRFKTGRAEGAPRDTKVESECGKVLTVDGEDIMVSTLLLESIYAASCYVAC